MLFVDVQMPLSYDVLFENLLEKVDRKEFGHPFYSTVQGYSEELKIEMKQFCEESISITKKVRASKKNKLAAIKDVKHNGDSIASQICDKIYNKDGTQLLRPLTELPTYKTYKEAIEKKLKRN